MDREMKEIQERILYQMKEKEMSYRDLGEMTGMAKSTLQRYLTKDNAKIPINRLEVIAQALGVSATYLMGWDNEPHPHRIRKAMSVEEFAHEFNIEFERLEPAFSLASRWREEVGDFEFTETETQELIDYARYLISKRRPTK